MTPLEASQCTRCGLCETRRNVVWGEGPTTTRAILIGEGPGEMEDKTGRPFARTGRAGVELRHALWRNGLDRDSFYITNAVKCRPPNNRDPKPNELAACYPWLLEEMAQLVGLNVICTVGRSSTRLFLGDVTMEQVHGKLFFRDDWPWPIMPIYHPAAGLHDPGTMSLVQADIEALSKVIKGADFREVQFVQDRGDNDYKLVDGIDLEIPDDTTILAIDTEWTEGETPWCLSYSHKPGFGRVIMADNRHALQRLINWSENPNHKTLLHNALADLPILEKMGFNPSKVSFQDTMVMAYLLQDEPQGLKVLAYRHAGMRMRDYGEVVGQANHIKAMQYIGEVVEREWSDPEEIMYWDGDTPKIKRPQNIKQKAVRILNDCHNNSSVDPRDRWHNIDEDAGRGQVEAVIGRMPEAWLCDVDFDEAVQYSAQDADATIRVYHCLWPRIVDNGLEGVFWRDMRITPMISDMMKYGVRVDRDHFNRLVVDFTAKMERLEKEISDVAGGPINPNSTPQVRRLLYEQLGLNAKKFTPTGPSTGAAALASLNHPVVAKILEWRSYQTLRDSFAKKTPRAIQADGRVHPTLRHTRVVTGRLASSNPNLMAQPVRSDEGKMIRDGYVPDDGFVFVSGDYSQIEMRVVAHDSQDPELLTIFREGLDIHSQTASKMFGIPVDQLDKQQHRYPAKRVGFGILYGITAAGLLAQLEMAGAADWTIEKCEQLIRSWFGVYKGVDDYMKRNRDFARRYGYVCDMWGRRRLVPGVWCGDNRIIEESLRQAANAPIQMGAQGVIKEAMGELVSVYRDFDGDVRPLLQIHDDILWEVREVVVEDWLPQVKTIMEQCVELLVPVEVDFNIGRRWGSMMSLEKWFERRNHG